MTEKIIYEPYGFVYITTNLINGKKYIGRCKMQTTRPNSWKNYLGSGVVLERAFKKYGKENFKRDIISFANDEEELNHMEMELIDFLDAVKSDDYYNVSNGQYSCYYNSCSVEEQQKIREKMKRNNFWNKASEEDINIQKQYLSEKMKGKNNPFYNKKHSNETKEKISKANQGKTVGDKNASYWKGKKGKDHCMYGFKFSEETKEKMSKSAKERIERIGYPTSRPIIITWNNQNYSFKTLKKSYEFCCEKNLLIRKTKTGEKNLCFDSYSKKINKNVVFDTFTYKFIDG